MQTRPALETSSMARRARTGVALALSLVLHCGIAYAVMDAASVYGLANVQNPSMSVEEVQSVVLEAIMPTDVAEPPPESAVQQASVAAPEPTPDKHVPETQIEKTEEPTAAEPTRQAAYQPPPPTPEAPAEATPAEVTPEPSVPVPHVVTIDRPEATEVPVPQPDPEAVLEEQKRQAAEQKRNEEEAQRQAALEQRRIEQEQEAKRQAELDQRQREKQREAEKREQERRKAEREAAEKRETEETERKRKSAQQAKEARKAKGAEHNSPASVASRGKAKDTKGSGRATASRGDILTYAALVQARVAANKPAASSSAGRVVVAFGVSGRGSLTYARVSRSSGQSGLDQVALAAVRRSGPFPPPPGGQPQTFSFPFTFN
jgi:TolA protein